MRLSLSLYLNVILFASRVLFFVLRGLRYGSGSERELEENINAHSYFAFSRWQGVSHTSDCPTLPPLFCGRALVMAQ
jgi:hypothetical protein